MGGRAKTHVIFAQPYANFGAPPHRIRALPNVDPENPRKIPARPTRIFETLEIRSSGGVSFAAPVFTRIDTFDGDIAFRVRVWVCVESV